jgi:hypothetical protein
MKKRRSRCALNRLVEFGLVFDLAREQFVILVYELVADDDCMSFGFIVGVRLVAI